MPYALSQTYLYFVDALVCLYEIKLFKAFEINKYIHTYIIHFAILSPFSELGSDNVN